MICWIYVQTWRNIIEQKGINFSRNIADLEERYAWSPVDSNIYKWYESLGTVNGLKNIEPPLRLFLYPYGQTALNLKKNSSPSSIYSAGLDIKYGLSNSFTLDATLIPDFGQVTFDFILRDRVSVISWV